MYYLIFPNAIMGSIYFDKMPHSAMADCKDIDEPAFVFFEFSHAREFHILSHGFYTICTNFAKMRLEQSGLSGIQFKQTIVKKSGNPDCLREESTDWWLLCIEELNSGCDFIKWQTQIIVSEPALKFLEANKIFNRITYGSDVGSQFEYTTNLLKVSGENFIKFITEEVPVFHQLNLEKATTYDADMPPLSS